MFARSWGGRGMPGTLYGDPAAARDDALLRIRTDLEAADLVIIGASNG